jgi:hypothetical protein
MPLATDSTTIRPRSGVIPLVWSMTTSTWVSALEGDRCLHARRSLRYHAPVVGIAAAQLACISAVPRPSTGVDADYSAHQWSGHLSDVTAPLGKEYHVPRTMQTECLLEPRFTVHVVCYPLAASWRPPHYRHGAADNIAVSSSVSLRQGLDILVEWYLTQVRPQSLRCVFRAHAISTEDDP